jgi:hypothetical protein
MATQTSTAFTSNWIISRTRHFAHWDELFIDHFMQGVLKHMRGSAEPAWTEDDEDDVFGDGSLNLSNATSLGN